MLIFTKYLQQPLSRFVKILKDKRRNFMVVRCNYAFIFSKESVFLIGSSIKLPSGVLRIPFKRHRGWNQVGLQIYLLKILNFSRVLTMAVHVYIQHVVRYLMNRNHEKLTESKQTVWIFQQKNVSRGRKYFTTQKYDF